jgi:hypothetical protein
VTSAWRFTASGRGQSAVTGAMAVPPVAGFVVASSAAPRGEPEVLRREAAGQRSGARRGRGFAGIVASAAGGHEPRSGARSISLPGETVARVAERARTCSAWWSSGPTRSATAPSDSRPHRARPAR